MEPIKTEPNEEKQAPDDQPEVPPETAFKDVPSKPLAQVRFVDKRKRKRKSSRSSSKMPNKRVKFAKSKKLSDSVTRLLARKSRSKSLKNVQKMAENDKQRFDCLARFGKNFYCPSPKQRTGLRPIYVDGSNVAFSHGQNERFSVRGLKMCIDYFHKRGHEVKAFIPHYRLRKGESTDQTLLHDLVNKKLVITTPTLYIQNQRRNPYDDWYIVQSAAANGGIVVSSDNFQDILKWNPNLRTVIEERRLVPTFVDDMLIFPVDPHGNRQNDLEQFLRF